MNELIPYVVKDTGTKLMIKRVSPLLVMELRKAFPEPEPPKQEVDVGGETRLEPNYSHPDYETALVDYNNEMEQRIRKFLIGRGVVIPEDNTTWRAELEDTRQFWVSEYNKELPSNGSDVVDWVLYCAVGSDEDVSELYATILRRSQPTLEAVEAAKSGFPS